MEKYDGREKALKSLRDIVSSTNVDKNGIRYGTVHSNEVLDACAELLYSHYGCEDCEENVNGSEEYEEECTRCCDPTHYEYREGGYEVFSDSYGDLIITKSPFYTLRGLASPCFPNGGHLLTEGGYETYCLPHDWFPEGKAPYRVYDVITGEEVFPAEVASEPSL